MQVDLIELMGEIINMVNFIVYFLLCLLSIFVDMCFNFNGYSTLLFNLMFVGFIYKKYKLSIKFNDINFFQIALVGSIINILIVILIEIIISFTIKININYDFYISKYFIVSLILMAFTEELIFRAYFLNILIEKYNMLIGIFLTSLIFATLHIFASKNPIIAFCGSLFLSLVYLKTKSIFSTIMIHLISNLFVVFFLTNILSFYLNLGFKSQIQSVFLILVVLFFLIKTLFKKSKK